MTKVLSAIWLSVWDMSWEGRYPRTKIVPADPSWQDRYAELAAELSMVLGPAWVLEHVGSTSVPGLVAKPVIDVALRIPDAVSLTAVSLGLVRAGWSEAVAVGDHWASFLLVDGVRSAIGHLVDSQRWPTAHVRLFSEWLRHHEVDRDRYAELKASLIKQGMWGRGYTVAKGAFVLEVVNRARAGRGMSAVTGPL